MSGCSPGGPGTTGPRAAAAAVNDGDTMTIRIGQPLAEIERAVILATLKRYDHHKERTAAALGVSLKTLYNRLKEYARSRRLAARRRGVGHRGGLLGHQRPDALRRRRERTIAPRHQHDAPAQRRVQAHGAQCLAIGQRQRQRRQDRQPQPLGHHAEGGGGVAHVQHHACGRAVAAQGLVDQGPAARGVVQQHQRLPSQRVQRHLGLLGQRMAGRAHQHEALLEHRLLGQVVDLVAAHHHREVDRPAAHAVECQALRLVGEQHLDVGMALLCRGQAAGHQPGGHGGRTGHPHHPAPPRRPWPGCARAVPAGRPARGAAGRPALRRPGSAAPRGWCGPAASGPVRLRARARSGSRPLRQADGIARPRKAAFIGDGKQHLQLPKAHIHKPAE